MNQQYKVAKGVLKRPRSLTGPRKVPTAADFIGQGELIPDGMLTSDAIADLLQHGLIEKVSVVQATTPGALPPRRGKWSVDPAVLVSKTLDELVIMVLEIDPDFDVAQITDAQFAVTQLTADWHPSFRDTLTRSTDRSRPEAMRSSGTKDAGSKPLSEAAAKALASAKERAQPATEGEASQD